MRTRQAQKKNYPGPTTPTVLLYRVICLRLFSRSPSTPCVAPLMACTYFIPCPRMMSSVVEAIRFLFGRTRPFPPEKSNLQQFCETRFSVKQNHREIIKVYSSTSSKLRVCVRVPCLCCTVQLAVVFTNTAFWGHTLVGDIHQ